MSNNPLLNAFNKANLSGTQNHQTSGNSQPPSIFKTGVKLQNKSSFDEKLFSSFGSDPGSFNLFGQSPQSSSTKAGAGNTFENKGSSPMGFGVGNTPPRSSLFGSLDPSPSTSPEALQRASFNFGGLGASNPGSSGSNIAAPNYQPSFGSSFTSNAEAAQKKANSFDDFGLNVHAKEFKRSDDLFGMAKAGLPSALEPAKSSFENFGASPAVRSSPAFAGRQPSSVLGPSSNVATKTAAFGGQSASADLGLAGLSLWGKPTEAQGSNGFGTTSAFSDMAVTPNLSPARTASPFGAGNFWKKDELERKQQLFGNSSQPSSIFAANSFGGDSSSKADSSEKAFSSAFSSVGSPSASAPLAAFAPATARDASPWDVAFKSVNAREGTRTSTPTLGGASKAVAAGKRAETSSAAYGFSFGSLGGENFFAEGESEKGKQQETEIETAESKAASQLEPGLQAEQQKEGGRKEGEKREGMSKDDKKKDDGVLSKKAEEDLRTKIKELKDYRSKLIARSDKGGVLYSNWELQEYVGSSFKFVPLTMYVRKTA